MTVYELTGQESGIVVYDSGEVLVVNWSGYEEDELPMLSPFGTVLSWDKGQGIFDNAQKRTVSDIRTELPGKVWATGETAENGSIIFDTDMAILWDQNFDLPRLFLRDLSPEEYTGTVYTLRDGTNIIAPSTWS